MPEYHAAAGPGAAAPPANFMTCTAPTASATAGQYENIGSVTGTDTEGTVVQDSDASHYFGEQASVTLEKYTGTDPADTATGPFFSVGDTVTWIYEITNTGNVPVTYQLTDNPAPAVGIACPRLLFIQAGTDDLSATQTRRRRPASTRTSRPWSRRRRPDRWSAVTDPANYFGVEGDIDIEKFTNGVNADLPPGPYVAVGLDGELDIRRDEHRQLHPHRHRGHRPQGSGGQLPE